MSKKKNKARVFVYLLALALIAACLVIYYFYNQSRPVEKNLETAANQEVAGIIAAAGKLMVLPANETPFLATVVNKEALRVQPFFKNAENGDKLLVYAKSAKAILYRPSENRIIEAGPIVLNNQPAAAQKLLKIAYYNGAGIAGITADAGQKIQAAFGAQGLTENFSESKAAKDDYEGVLVVDLTGRNSTSTQVIAAFLDGSVGSMPAGESAPQGADVLVILGK